MVSCDHQRTTQPHHIKDSLAYDIESIKIIPSNDILELKSYHITSPFSCQNIDGIIAYNYRLHSLDLIDLYNHKEISYNPQIQISAESETKRSIFREKDKTKRSKKESAQHSKSRNKSFVMTSVSAL